jgi:hypothetical protein
LLRVVLEEPPLPAHGDGEMRNDLIKDQEG